MVVGTEPAVDQHSTLLVWHRVVVDMDHVPRQPLIDKVPDVLYPFP